MHEIYAVLCCIHKQTDLLKIILKKTLSVHVQKEQTKFSFNENYIRIWT